MSQDIDALEYTTQHNVKSGRVTGTRWVVANPPPKGTKVQTSYGVFEYVGEGIAGMLTVKSEDSDEHMIMPPEVIAVGESVGTPIVRVSDSL